MTKEEIIQETQQRRVEDYQLTFRNEVRGLLETLVNLNRNLERTKQEIRDYKKALADMEYKEPAPVDIAIQEA